MNPAYRPLQTTYSAHFHSAEEAGHLLYIVLRPVPAEELAPTDALHDRLAEHISGLL